MNRAEPRRRTVPNVFLYSHDTYGLGHLRRNLAIAEHLLSGDRPFSVRLLTGSPVIANWSLPLGLNVTALPPVVKTGVETYKSRDSKQPFSRIKASREALILKSVIEEKPDFLIVDHAPAGMNAELLPALAFIRRELPGTQVILGLRDILDDPQTVQSIWAEQKIIPLLDTFYDYVLVYGSRALFDVVENYRLPGSVSAKLRYSGYVARLAGRAVERASGEGATVLVTAGGGEDGFFLMKAYLDALARGSLGSIRSRIVTGPLMSPEERRTLVDYAQDDPAIEIIPSTMDLPTMLDGADLVIAMAGYNTSVEIVASGKPAILVPRAAPRAEQKMRAEMLARLGYVWAVEPEPELGRRLSELVAAFLAGARPQLGSERLDLCGARRVGKFLETLISDGAALRDVA